MVARPADKLRYGLFDNELSIHHLSGQIEKRKIRSSSELAAVLKEHFRIRLPLGCEAVLERFASKDAE
jgi:arylamine N-acetyltransferase